MKMLCRTVFVFSIGLVLVKLVEMEQMEIKFEIAVKTINKGSVSSCDHSLDKIMKYTVLEGDDFKIKVDSKPHINDFRCSDKNDRNNKLYMVKHNDRNVYIVTVLESSSGVWDCRVLTHRDNEIIQPVVMYENNSYAAANCYMQLHVRRKSAPQKILVNNMALKTVRTDLSEKDIDLIAEYIYADEDIVDVNCFKMFNDSGQLSMSFDYADKLNSNLNSKQLSSYSELGFRARMNPQYDDTNMVCSFIGTPDYTKVSVKFVRQTKFNNIINLKINEMILRPQVTNVNNNYYELEYLYIKDEQLQLECEIKRKDLKLSFTDDDANKFKSYVKNTVTDQITVVSFRSAVDREITLRCTVSKHDEIIVLETVEIKFRPKFLPVEQCKLNIDLPENNTAMVLYSENHKIILYEFKDGDDYLTINCSATCRDKRAIMYVHFKDSTPQRTLSTVKFLHLIRQKNTVQTCYMTEQVDNNSKHNKVHSEIRVIFRKKVLTTTTTSTTTSSTTSRTTTHPIITSSYGAVPDSNATTVEPWILGLIGGVTCIFIICVSTVIFKLRKRNYSQRRRYDRNYENLSSPSEASIPAFPPQWDSNYAVPVDQRREDPAIYSVPECPLYTSAIPKHARVKKATKTDLTYAVLDIGCSNTASLNRPDLEPDYAQVRNNKIEQCYAKVLPKSQRRQEDSDPYTYIQNERAYASVNNGCAEPLYSEPAVVQRTQYTNVMDSTRYANCHGNESVEPAYCEARKK